MLGIETREMENVEKFVKERLHEMNAEEMIAAMRDEFLNVALIGYGACYYLRLMSLNK